MKILKSEFNTLLDCAPAAPASAHSVPAPLPSPAKETAPASSLNDRYTPAHKEIGNALPRLWAHAKKETLSRSEHRKKLRALLVWLAEKKGWQAQALAPMQYQQNNERIAGKVDLIISEAGKALLTVEADWNLQEASLHKLAAAHAQGSPVLWVSGLAAANKEEAREARRFAMKLLGKNCGQWLLIYHLEHGWV